MEYYGAQVGEDRYKILSLIQVSSYKADYIFDIFRVREAIRESGGS